MVSLKIVKDYLRIDFDADDALLNLLISVADNYLRGAITDYDRLLNQGDFKSKAEMCQIVIIQDLYENRNQGSYGTKDFGYTIRSMIGQLQYTVLIEGAAG